MGRVTGWNSTKVETGGKRKELAVLAHTTPDSSSSLTLASPSPILHIVTHSRSVSHRCDAIFVRVYGHYFPCLAGYIRAVAGRTHARTRCTRLTRSKVTSAHCRSSNRIALSLSRSTSLHPNLQILALSFFLSLSFSLSLALSPTFSPCLM